MSTEGLMAPDVLSTPAQCDTRFKTYYPLLVTVQHLAYRL